MPSRALVTGGGRGIGAGIARELAGDGWEVTVTGRTAAQVEEVAAEIGGPPSSATSRSARTSNGCSPTAGAIDLLVANAGVALWEESWETDIEEWWHVLEVNVLGAYLTCRLALPGMIERGGGRIVITGSGASYLPGSTSGAYSASKAAVGRFGEVLANQVKDDNVKVFVISPGLVKTELIGDRMPEDAPVDAAGAGAPARPGAGLRPLRPALRPLHPRRARPAGRAGAADRPDPGRGPERDPDPPGDLMLYRPEDFEPVTDERWEESRVRAAIARIVADVDEAYRRQRLWPAPPDTPVAPGRPEPTLYRRRARRRLGARRAAAARARRVRTRPSGGRARGARGVAREPGRLPRHGPTRAGLRRCSRERRASSSLPGR